MYVKMIQILENFSLDPLVYINLIYMDIYVYSIWNICSIAPLHAKIKDIKTLTFIHRVTIDYI